MLIRCATLLTVLVAGCGRPQPSTVVLSVCELSRDFTAYRGKLVSVRGIYWYGLRQTCPQSCPDGPWPSYVDLMDADFPPPPGEPPVTFATDDSSWAAMDRVQRAAEIDAKQGKRVEIWVTVLGQIRTSARRSPVGPCDLLMRSGYGHTRSYPAELVVKSVSNIQVVPNANSPYDYSQMYHGAL